MPMLVIVLLVVGTVGLLASPSPELALLPAVAALVGLALLRRPVLALYLIVALIPFAAYRRIAGDISLPWLLAGFLLAVLALHMAVERRIPNLPSTPMWPVMIGYLAVSALSALMSPFPDVARHEVFLTASGAAFVLLVIVFLPPEGLLKTLHRVIIWSVSTGAMMGIVGYFFGIQAFGEDNPDGASFRAIGGAIDPNNQSIMLLFALPLTFHQALYADSRTERLMMRALIPVLMFGVVMTMSRSGFLMAVLSLVLLAWHYRHLLHPRQVGIVFVGAVVGGTVFLSLVPASFIERQASLLEWEDRSLNRRATYLYVARDAFLEAPILGIGPNTYSMKYAESDYTRMFTSDPDRMRRRAHNTYLEILVGTGVVGFGLYMAMLVLSLRHLTRSEKSFKEAGDQRSANLLASYRIGYVVLLVFLLMLSDTYHKYMLLVVGLSQVALLASGALSDQAGLGRLVRRRSALKRITTP